MLSKIKNKSIGSIAILLIGTAISAISTILTTIIIARNTNLEVFGNYSTILATITTFSIVAGFGISQYWLKLFGQYGSYAILWVKNSLLFILISSMIVLLSLFVWFSYISETVYLLMSSLILSSIIFKRISIELVNSMLQIDSKYLYVSLWQIFHSSFIFIIVLFFVYIFSFPLNELLLSYIQMSSVVIIVLINLYLLSYFYKKHLSNTNIEQLNKLRNENNISIKNIFLESFPFGIAGLFYLIYYQIGIVFIRYLEGAEATAFYNVAFTFLTAALLVPSVIYQKFLIPKLHKWVYHDKEKFILSYKYGNYAMLVLGLVVFLIIWSFASYLVHLFFGEQYSSSIQLVELMALNIPIVYVASSAGSLLVTQNHMKIKVKYMGFSALLSLLLNFPMIEEFGVKGAIYTNIISNIFILLMYLYKVEKDIVKRYKIMESNDR